MIRAWFWLELKWQQVRGGEPGAGEQVHDQGEELRRQDAERRLQVAEVRAEVHQEQPPSQVQYDPHASGSTSTTRPVYNVKLIWPLLFSPSYCKKFHSNLGVVLRHANGIADSIRTCAPGSCRSMIGLCAQGRRSLACRSHYPNRVEFPAWSSSPTRSCNDAHASLGNGTAGNYAAGGPATGAGDERAAAERARARMWKPSGCPRPRTRTSSWRAETAAARRRASGVAVWRR